MARQVLARPIMGKYPKPLIHCTGKPETDKSQLAISFALWLAKALNKDKCYVWPTDSREHEYAEVLGDENVLAPLANPLDVSDVQDEISADLRSGTFNQVALFSVDTVTHIKAPLHFGQWPLSVSWGWMTGGRLDLAFFLLLMGVSYFLIASFYFALYQLFGQKVGRFRGRTRSD